jgi:hypothetical protein
MAKRRTWLWIVLGIAAVCIIFVIAAAGFGIYFIRSHVTTAHTSSAEALQSFDEVRGLFKDPKPLFEFDRNERPQLTRRVEDLPTAAKPAEMMYVLVWDPDKERVIRLSMPFWMLRLGRQKIDLAADLDFRSLQLDVKELERVGPVMLFDFRPVSGERVLVWTQ